MKPHEVQNYDLYSGKGLSHTSGKPLEKILGQKKYLNTWTTMQLDSWAAEKEPRKGERTL